jgi:Flp pilus assembly protein TadG
VGAIRGRGQRGATFVEAAISLLAFLMIVMGIMEFGRLVWIYDTVSYIAREGTRYASVRGSGAPTPATAADIRQAVLREAIGLDPGSVNVAVAWTPNNDPTGVVTVTVTYTANSLVGWIPTPTIRARSTMVISQ